MRSTSASRIAVGGLLTALATGALGCGGSGSPDAARAAVGTARAQQAGRRPPSVRAGKPSTTVRNTGSPRAQYLAFAHAVNLRPTDVPGFRVEHKHEHVHLQFNAPESDLAKHCVRVGNEPKPTLKARSLKLSTGRGFNLEEVKSEVEIERSVSAARRGFAEVSRLLSDAGTRRCLARSFDKLGAHGSTTIHTRFGPAKVGFAIGDLRVAPIPLGPGAEDALGMSLAMGVRYTVSVRGRTRTLPPVMLQFDELGFRVGRAAVSLSVIGFGRACAPEREAQLYSLLTSRANAAGSRYPDVRPQASPGTTS